MLNVVAPIARIQVRERDLYGRWASRWRVIRTSNAYVFRDPQQRPEGVPASKSENRSGTRNQDDSTFQIGVFRCSNDGYPLTGSNNVNGIDDKGGIGSMTMTAPNAITATQDAYVDKMIDTLNNLPNVLWIVSEESPASSAWWNNHLIAHVRSYESTKPMRHAVGYAAHAADEKDRIFNSWIYDSNADWVAPAARISPTKTCGSGVPTCKVNINDSDHSYFGIWNDSAEQNRAYVWRNFLSGNQVIFMDPYVIYYPRENRNLCLLPVQGILFGSGSALEQFPRQLGICARVCKSCESSRHEASRKLIFKRIWTRENTH